MQRFSPQQAESHAIARNLATRVAVAVVGIPFILFLAYVGGFAFIALVVVIGTLSLVEFYRMSKYTGARPQTVLGTLSGVLVMLSFAGKRIENLVVGASISAGSALPFPSPLQMMSFAIFGLMLLALIIELFRREGLPFVNLGATVLGVFYVAFLLGTLIGIRELFPAEFPVHRFFPEVVGIAVPESIQNKINQWGGLTVVSLFVTIWMCDTAAYFVGLSIGRHSLFSRVSPKKTWEGAVGGFVFAVLTSFVLQKLLIPYLTSVDAIVIGAIVGVFGQVGDLIESRFKREAGVKDTSSLIPGHGGALDRFDSLIFVSPIVYLYLDFIVFR